MVNFLLHSKEVIGQEVAWTYNLDPEIFFNQQFIKQVTITDHWLIKHSKVTISQILDLIGKLHLVSLDPTVFQQREVYKWEVGLQAKKYRLIFWFKDNSEDHLWVRNCYRID